MVHDGNPLPRFRPEASDQTMYFLGLRHGGVCAGAQLQYAGYILSRIFAGQLLPFLQLDESPVLDVLTGKISQERFLPFSPAIEKLCGCCFNVVMYQ